MQICLENVFVQIPDESLLEAFSIHVPNLCVLEQRRVLLDNYFQLFVTEKKIASAPFWKFVGVDVLLINQLLKDGDVLQARADHEVSVLGAIIKIKHSQIVVHGTKSNVSSHFILPIYKGV